MNTKTEEKTCAACEFWESSSSDSGSCRRNAPQSVVFEVSSEQTIKTVFPTTKADDWCGEFSEK